jgi:hypothetical protein
MNGIQIDLNTLLVVTVCNVAALAIVSPAVMGRRISEAARQRNIFSVKISRRFHRDGSLSLSG